jgi:hypothetical protein
VDVRVWYVNVVRFTVTRAVPLFPIKKNKVGILNGWIGANETIGFPLQNNY